MKLAVVTPLKDELGNLPMLIKSMEDQVVPIEYWVVVENGSVDGSREFLAGLKEVKNVNNLVVLNFCLPVEKYELGVKYATVVSQGFEWLKKNDCLSKIDYVGILDADCFPGSEYYQELTNFMKGSSEIGISSGLAYTLDGVYDGKSRDWVRGNCRLWKKECFLEAGYIIGPSADALSVCKAEVKGWRAIPSKDLIYKCREVGSKVDYSYYGYSAYFRGISPLFAFMKSVKYMLTGKLSNGGRYFSGYFGALFGKKSKVQDAEILEYFSGYGLKVLMKRLRRDSAG